MIPTAVAGEEARREWWRSDPPTQYRLVDAPCSGRTLAVPPGGLVDADSAMTVGPRRGVTWVYRQ